MSVEDYEKGVALDHVNNINQTTTQTADLAAINAFTPKQQKNIYRRIDFRLVTTLGLIYSVSLMDRTNLGNAAISG
jgi:hypothetical protein